MKMKISLVTSTNEIGSIIPKKQKIAFADQHISSEVLSRISHQLERVRQLTIATLPSGPPAHQRVLIFGEIFGGSYPHAAVPAVEGVQAVQTGVYYSPRIEFCAFDLALALANSSAHSYLNYEIATKIFHEAGLFHATPLLTGTWTECLAYELPFESTIPARLGLPPLKDANNAEGIVVKSMTELVIATRQGKSTRAILKKKIAEFAEDKRYHQAQKWTPPPSHAGLPPLTMLLVEVDALMTDARLAAAISKVGPMFSKGVNGTIAPNRERSNQVLSLMIADIQAELTRSHAIAYRGLNATDRQVLTDSISEQSKRMILDYLKRMKEGS